MGKGSTVSTLLDKVDNFPFTTKLAMKPFAVTLLALAAANAVNGEINHVAPGGPSGPNTLTSAVHQPAQAAFAESRNAGDSYGAPSAPIVDSYSSSSNAAWANDPVPQAYPYNFGGGASFSAPGFNANAEVGVPNGQGFLNTALTIVFALVGFSLLINLITTIAKVPIIANLVGQARSLDANSMMDYTNMAMNGIQKMKEIYENLE